MNLWNFRGGRKPVGRADKCWKDSIRSHFCVVIILYSVSTVSSVLFQAMNDRINPYKE